MAGKHELKSLASKMTQFPLKHVELRHPWPAQVQRFLLWSLIAAFTVMWMLLLLGAVQASPWYEQHCWPDAVLLLVATAISVASLSRELPLQNITGVVALVIVGSGMIFALAGFSGIPFGPFVFTTRIGNPLLPGVPWPIPLLWVVVLLNARAVARLLLRPIRQNRNYGFWLLAVAGLLVALFDFNLEPFATQVRRYWLWHSVPAGLDWYRVPFTSFLGWFATGVLLLVLTMPFFLNKKPVPSLPPRDPLFVWLMLNLLFCLSTLAQHLWASGITNLLINSLIFALALLGARNRQSHRRYQP